ncbi:MAG: MoxR family ATPase [Thaumarchaeota archaeon]|nr:MoxR family ATPase [Nitrososphaerota archaeon]
MVELLAQKMYEKLQNEMSKTIVGKSDVVRLLVIALLSDGHVLLEGVPGVAKTLIAKSFSKCLGLNFKRIQLTPDMLPSDITGTFTYNVRDQVFVFREGPVFANVILADEINRAIPKTQSALLEAMQEKQVTVEGITKKLPDPFIVLATQNPVEMQGTYPLPEAQLDRFMFRVIIITPDQEDEVEILRKSVAGIDPEDLQTIVNVKEIIEARYETRKEVTSSKEVMNYIVSLVSATRKDAERVMLGASPRASVQLLAASKTLAAINGRSYVTPDDVKRLVFPALNHRILLNPEYVLRTGNVGRPFDYDALNTIIAGAVSTVEPPR